MGALSGSLAATGGVGALLQVTNHHSNGTATCYFPTTDGNGNIVALIRQDGALAAVYEYSPFGEPLRVDAIDPAISGQPFRFSSKYTDDESGLVYYGYRYYSPKDGRFINRDPIGEAGGINLYGFAGNDAVGRIDFLGLSAADGKNKPSPKNPTWIPLPFDPTPQAPNPDLTNTDRVINREADNSVNRTRTDGDARTNLGRFVVGRVSDADAASAVARREDAPDSEGRSSTGRWVRFGIGALLAWIHGNNPNPFATEPVFADPDERQGAMVGHGIAILTGVGEMQVGGTIVAGSGVAEVVTVGGATPVAVPAAIGGTALAAHGGVTAYKGLSNLVEMKMEGGVGKYGDVGGHHIHAKSAFKDHATYKPGEGWAISQEYMKARGWNHQRMTNHQRKAFAEMKAGQRPNTIQEHNKIAIEALEAGGASHAEAVQLATQSVGNLFQQGAKVPTHIPWSK